MTINKKFPRYIGKDVEYLQLSYVDDGDVTRCSYLGTSSSKRLNKELAYYPVMLILVTY